MSKNTKSAPSTSTEKPLIENDPKYGAMITLNPWSKFTFRFGAGKARMIVEHFDAIKKFADANPRQSR